MKFTVEEKSIDGNENVPIAVVETKRFNKHNKPLSPNRKIIYYTDDDEGLDAYFAEKGEVIYPIPFLTKGQRVCVSVSGASGVGKSTMCARLIDEVMKIDKETNGTAVFTSAVELDPALEKLKNVCLIDIPNSMETATIEDMRNMIGLFDDFGFNPNPQCNVFLHHYLGSLLERSRKLHCHLIVASHDQRSYNKTKLLNLESQSFVVFPTNQSESTKILKDYLGFNRHQIEYSMNIKNGRFTYIYVSRVPFYLISQDRIIMINTIKK